VNPQPKQPAAARAGGHDDVDRRDLQRVPIECNALVRLAEYLTFRAQLRNISADAVQVICDPRYALLIQPGGSESTPNGDRLIDISVALPEYDDSGDFKAQCRVKYCVEDAEEKERMILGLQFVTMDFRSVQHLDRFMESHG
jgi:c-di-GMP-binding flagellar brake protein YcgR